MISHSPRKMSFAQALTEATDLCLEKDSQVFVFGLGVDDPKRIFGTTQNLVEKYGPQRVFDVPLSENALTGIAIGAAIQGMRPLLTHQRLDFALLSLDQIINNAAKWHYMFAGQQSVPLTIRMIMGRGWGQGPQHSQHLHALFAHIPGLKVVLPSTPHDAKGLLISAIEDNDPVIFLEHRWLHSVVGPVPQGIYREPLGKAKIVKSGSDITLVGISYMTLEAYRAAEYLESVGITAEVIDLRTVKPFDGELIAESVKKTGRLLVADTGHLTGGISGEVIAWVSERFFSYLKVAPRRIASPDWPVPTTAALAKFYYPKSHDIFLEIAGMLGLQNDQKIKNRDRDLQVVENQLPTDVPDLSFTGPF